MHGDTAVIEYGVQQAGNLAVRQGQNRDIGPPAEIGHHRIGNRALELGIHIACDQGIGAVGKAKPDRLKLIKRQMYGRAAFDLLQKRVLPRPLPP